jgi:hypothetical protein
MRFPRVLRAYFRKQGSEAFQGSCIFPKEAQLPEGREQVRFPKEGKTLHLWRFPKEAGKRVTYVFNGVRIS